MGYRLTIPARINILGNPSDANEGDFSTISAAVDVRAGGIVEADNDLVLEALERTDGQFTTTRRLEFGRDQIPLPYDGELDLLKGAVNRMHHYSAEFRVKFAQRGVRIATWTDVPRQSGLGGSSLFVLLALAGLREFYDLNRHVHNDYILAELTQRVEARELAITCGFADRYVPLFGGIAYLDYRGKLYQADIQAEPSIAASCITPTSRPSRTSPTSGWTPGSTICPSWPSRPASSATRATYTAACGRATSRSTTSGSSVAASRRPWSALCRVPGPLPGRARWPCWPATWKPLASS
jgi:galactokinase